MKLFCIFGIHLWTNCETWATRRCRGCQHTEIFVYDKERGGPFWERVS